MVRPKGARLDIRIEADILGRVEAEAAALDRSVSWVVREALRQYLATKKGRRET